MKEQNERAEEAERIRELERYKEMVSLSMLLRLLLHVLALFLFRELPT